MTRRLLIALLACLSLSTGTALAASHLNAYALQGQFICISCHEPLNQVNSPESQAEKTTLDGLVAQGLSLGQIKAQMVDIYGEGVLAAPPAHGINLLVYILPPLVLVGGLVLIAVNLPRWRRRGRATEAVMAAPLEPPLDPADARRLDRELADFDA